MSRKTKLSKGEEMHKNQLMKKVIKREGKGSCISKKIMALKPSKEFNYLVDIEKI
jgi:hypothetical protein